MELQSRIMVLMILFFSSLQQVDTSCWLFHHELEKGVCTKGYYLVGTRIFPFWNLSSGRAALQLANHMPQNVHLS